MEIRHEPITIKRTGADAPRPKDKSEGRALRSQVHVGEVVYLKDSWRIAAAGMEKEGDIYCELHDHEVRHIPSLVCAGDVYCGRWLQETRTNSVLAKDDWIAYDSKLLKLERHVHYRIVLGEVGKPLTEFSSTKEVLQVLHDALEGEPSCW